MSAERRAKYKPVPVLVTTERCVVVCTYIEFLASSRGIFAKYGINLFGAIICSARYIAVQIQLLFV